MSTEDSTQRYPLFRHKKGLGYTLRAAFVKGSKGRAQEKMVYGDQGEQN